MKPLIALSLALLNLLPYMATKLASNHNLTRLRG